MLIARGYCFQVFYLDDNTDVFQAFTVLTSIQLSSFCGSAVIYSNLFITLWTWSTDKNKYTQMKIKYNLPLQSN